MRRLECISDVFLGRVYSTASSGICQLPCLHVECPLLGRRLVTIKEKCETGNYTLSELVMAYSHWVSFYVAALCYTVIIFNISLLHFVDQMGLDEMGEHVCLSCTRQTADTEAV